MTQAIKQTLRAKTYYLLESKDRHTSLHRVFDISFLLLILLNILAIALETIGDFYQSFRQWFYVFELISVMIFSTEYLLRVWVSVDAPQNAHKKSYQARLAYIFSPLGLIDLLAILPFYLSFLQVDLRYLRVLRLMRIFKLTHYFDGLTLLMDVLAEEAEALLATLFILMVMLIIAASGIYLVEQHAQPENFSSIPASMWWAVVTLTTVGYGDVTPITPMGKFFSALITIIGVGMAALPAGILASGMNTQMKKKSDQLQKKYQQAIADGHIDANEQLQIEDLRKHLGLSQRQAQSIFNKINIEQQTNSIECPYCQNQIQLTLTSQQNSDN